MPVWTPRLISKSMEGDHGWFLDAIARATSLMNARFVAMGDGIPAGDLPMGLRLCNQLDALGEEATAIPSEADDGRGRVWHLWFV